ncbi:hypothetical protein CK503_01335 [Aliifodinibius salipaludis]|uniref:DUF2207 domain-containing protein n=1 Tax=Fodinibius salipaludis TaxID=2032627 RepID=A0A2A2GG31_9BACT|nr:DUF2207 domain-containing protein [Aliifodinibius salipaludis]PAU95732.1 hypothetical protein CK503_01335 [Aliifodinibius salipaludis]
MWIRTLILSIILIGSSFLSTSAKSYEIPDVRVEITIDADGTVHVTEHLTYVFDGSFSWAEYEIPRQGFSALTNIQIQENGKSYINENTESSGTFSVAENKEAIKLTWYYSAEDEKRTFTVSYTLQEALTVGPKWSQFFWNYLSNERDKSTSQLKISIQLPESVSGDSLYGWTRGPKGQFDLQKSAGMFTINASNIDDDEFAKVRAIFPTAVLNKSPISVTDEDFSLSQAQKEEQTYQEKRDQQIKRQEYLSDLWETLNYMIILFSIAGFYFLYRKYGKRHSTSRFSSKETIMAPGEIRPAAIGWLLQGQNITSNLLMATVLDLAREGYFKIQEEPPEEGFLADDKPTFSIERTEKQLDENLQEWENQIITFVEQRLKDGHQKLHNIFGGTNSEVSSWFTKWRKNLKEYAFDQNWVDEKSYTGCYWNIAVQSLLVIASIPALIYAGPVGLMSLFVSAFALIFSFLIIRRTPEGEEVYHQWSNYKEGLKNAKEHSISSDKLDKHFIYGLAFGLGEKELESIIATNANAVPVIAWIAFSSNTSSVASVASSFSTLGATGATSFPGTAGGAGASAGAAGGGASASAG